MSDNNIMGFTQAEFLFSFFFFHRMKDFVLHVLEIVLRFYREFFALSGDK